MFTASRVTHRLTALSLVLAAGLLLAGCGSGAAAKVGRAAASSTESPVATTSAPATPAPATHPKHTPGYRMVRVAKYGLAYELPRGWITLDGKNVLKGPNPLLDDLTRRLGMTSKQFIDQFASHIETYSVSDQGAIDGALDTVNTIGGAGELNLDQLRLQLATVGAKMGKVEYATSEPGDVIRIPYRLRAKGRTLHAVALAVVQDGATVLITVGSHDDATAGRRADQIQASLRSITKSPDV